ncbi:contractile injection system protein, VgrG/Pvc8 family [Pandoraea fibrosis]|uniref:Late control protein n=1 Tax=Pandoraea fibrosis TaxID=1891094 RepID=A0A5E4XF48_9BURK|nr:contractile injection system protein, VgrG/Pvc8 family [Pandoraea fibrosis]VVE34946.1 late control protein [Pandoraea fibrosis]
MTPDFSIVADGHDITPHIATRLVRGRITDEAGVESDQCSLTLDDRGNVLAWPAKGAKLTVSLGYKETGLHKMGDYVVDEVEYSEPPAQFVIRAKAADYANAYLKTQKTRSWPKNTTIGQLVTKIASEYKLKARVSPSLASVQLPTTHQTEESDLHLLTRIAREFDAIAKPAAGHLLFVKKGQSVDAAGRPLPTVQVTKSGKTSVRVIEADRDRYRSVLAYFHDPNSGRRVPVRFDIGEPTFTLRYNYANRDQAFAAARAKRHALDRNAKQLNVSMPGDALAVAESPLKVSGFREGVNGDWVASGVYHDFSRQGFNTTIKADPRLTRSKQGGTTK